MKDHLTTHPGFNSVAVCIRDAKERLVTDIGDIRPSLCLTQAVL